MIITDILSMSTSQLHKRNTEPSWMLVVVTESLVGFVLIISSLG